MQKIKIGDRVQRNNTIGLPGYIPVSQNGWKGTILKIRFEKYTIKWDNHEDPIENISSDFKSLTKPPKQTLSNLNSIKTTLKL